MFIFRYRSNGNGKGYYPPDRVTLTINNVKKTHDIFDDNMYIDVNDGTGPRDLIYFVQLNVGDVVTLRSSFHTDYNACGNYWYAYAPEDFSYS